MDRRRKMRQLRKRGYSLRSIGERYKVSRQRVHQILFGYTSRTKMYRRHFVNAHRNPKKFCIFCEKEKLTGKLGGKGDFLSSA